MQILDSTISSVAIKNNASRAKNAIIVFRLLLICVVLTLLVHLIYLQLLTSMYNGKIVNDMMLTSVDIALATTGILYGIVFITGIVYFLLWFRRAYGNLHRLKLDYLEYSSVMAGVSWFIPIVNLFVPYKIMELIWEETQIQARKDKSEFYTESSGILGIWWGLLILSLVLNIIAATYNKSIDTSQMIIGGYISIVQTLLIGISLFFLIKIINRIAAFEEELYTNETRKATAKEFVS